MVRGFFEGSSSSGCQLSVGFEVLRASPYEISGPTGDVVGGSTLLQRNLPGGGSEVVYQQAIGDPTVTGAPAGTLQPGTYAVHGQAYQFAHAIPGAGSRSGSITTAFRITPGTDPPPADPVAPGQRRSPSSLPRWSATAPLSPSDS